MIQTFKDLAVWNVAMELAADVYRWTEEFPKHEQFGLTSQIRRAVVSIPANIAEGNGRDSTKDYLRFLAIARGSLAELDTEIQLAQRFRYGNLALIEPIAAKIQQVSRMLLGLQSALRKKLNTTAKRQG